MDLDLAGRSVIVTGSSRGIGRAIASAFAEEGARLTIVARTQADIESTATVMRAAFPGIQVNPVAADITDEAGAERIIASAVGAFGGVDVLVNNAGGTVREGNLDERWEGSFHLNVMSVVRMMELARPYLLKSSQAAIVNIASIFGREYGPPAAPQYTGTKAAEIALSKTYAMHWAKDGIRVNSVAPGSVAFPGGSWGRRIQQDPDGMERFQREQIAAGRFGTPEEIASVVVFLASPRASWVLGTSLNVDGGQSRSGI